MEKKARNNFIPFGGISEKIYLEALVDDFSGLNLYFSFDKDDTKSIKVIFESFLSYRNSDESERFNYLKINLPFIKGCALFKTNYSDYIEWIIKESQEIRKGDEMIHFLFVTPNDIIEVISLEEPTIETFDKKEQIFLRIGSHDS